MKVYDGIKVLEVLNAHEINSYQIFDMISNINRTSIIYKNFSIVMIEKFIRETRLP